MTKGGQAGSQERAMLESRRPEELAFLGKTGWALHLEVLEAITLSRLRSNMAFALKKSSLQEGLFQF